MTLSNLTPVVKTIHGVAEEFTQHELLYPLEIVDDPTELSLTVILALVTFATKPEYVTYYALAIKSHLTNANWRRKTLHHVA